MAKISTNHFAINTKTLQVRSNIRSGTHYIISEGEDKQWEQLIVCGIVLLPCKYCRITIIVCVYEINYLFVIKDCLCHSSLSNFVDLTEMKVRKLTRSAVD